MRAAYYKEKGAAADVLTVGEVETPEPGPARYGYESRFRG